MKNHYALNNEYHSPMIKICAALNKEELAEKELISPKFLAPFRALFRYLFAPFGCFSETYLHLLALSLRKNEVICKSYDCFLVVCDYFFGTKSALVPKK